MKENFTSSFCMFGVFKNSLRYVYGLKCLSSCTGCEIALNTGANATKFFTLVTKS